MHKSSCSGSFCGHARQRMIVVRWVKVGISYTHAGSLQQPLLQGLPAKLLILTFRLRKANSYVPRALPNLLHFQSQCAPSASWYGRGYSYYRYMPDSAVTALLGVTATEQIPFLPYCRCTFATNKASKQVTLCIVTSASAKHLRSGTSGTLRCFTNYQHS